jgi:hypothetical protein
MSIMKTVAFAFSALLLAAGVAGAALSNNTAGLSGSTVVAPVTVVAVDLPAR